MTVLLASIKALEVVLVEVCPPAPMLVLVLGLALEVVLVPAAKLVVVVTWKGEAKVPAMQIAIREKKVRVLAVVAVEVEQVVAVPP